MKTREKFHVEKENYDRLWQSFTERLQKGKKKVTQAYPASTKQGKEQNHSLLDTKRVGERKFYNCDNKCMCLQHLTPG